MKNFLLLTAGIALFTAAEGQGFDLDKVGGLKAKDLVKFNGGISANTIFYSGNGNASRAPFTYFINGTLNARIADLVDVPISFNFSNSGRNFNLPTAPTRLGLHPKYKSVTGHLGDVSMVFSPYTLNGYLFRGAGVDVEPEGPLQVSAMAGRLQKAAEYDSSNQVVPAAYYRFGYGTKISYRQKLYRLGLIVFSAKDKVSSLQFKPDSLNVQPKQNLVLSWSGAIMPVENMEINVELAQSALTQDSRDTFAVASNKKLLTSLAGGNNSTSFYKALKANLNYRYKNSMLGVGYERVDPGYETLGAYYFNNDLENITVNVAQPFLKNKGQISANMGVQRDNLDNNKIGSSKRVVGAINASYAPTNKLTSSISYSNFTTYQRILPLFQNLNQTVTPFSNLDTLDYSQVSSNANANLNYILQQGADKLQSVNANISYQNVSDRQGGIKQFGSNSQLLALAGSYTVAFVPQEATIVVAVNTTTNKVAGTNFTLWGPTLSLSKRFLKRLNTNLVAAYNTASGGQVDGSVFITRLNSTYTVLQKHNLSLNLINQNRNLKTGGRSTNDFVATIGYNFFF